jgi:hypothetical protein
MLTPAWVLRQNAPVPGMAFESAHTPLLDELSREIGEAKGLGLQVGLHPVLIVPDGTTEAWWADAPRDRPGGRRFERYRSFVLTYAALAGRAGARSVLGGPEWRRCPEGVGRWLTVGGAEGCHCPLAFVDRGSSKCYRGHWPSRSVYSTLQAAAVPRRVDQVHVYWHVPLGEGRALTSAEMQAAAFAALDGSLLADPILKLKPIYLSVEYLSVDGGATGCAQNADGSCRPPEAFDAGADPDPDLRVDLEEQSEALNAVMLAAYARDAVQGFYARRYYPPVALHDKSASVNGKLAGQMLGYWFTRING